MLVYRIPLGKRSENLLSAFSISEHSENLLSAFSMVTPHSIVKSKAHKFFIFVIFSYF